ncbi:MAG: hypothetical protein ACKVQK_16795 [Burkholderiales bacterium]
MVKSRPENGELKAVRDLASEEIMSLPESEIRARAKEDGIDIEKNAFILRNFLKEKKSISGRDRLQQARQNVHAVNEPSPQYNISAPTSIDEIRVRLAELFASGLMANDSRITLAHRNGTEMSEDDMRSLLEDYEDLLAKSRSDPNASS